jgi:peptidyl-prolyl cis-trans isomerase D
MEADLKTQQAQRKFAETAETFTNGVYEQSDSLKPVAERLKLEVKTVSNLQRKSAPGVTGVLANPKFLAAVFSADSLEKKRNTEAVEVGPSQLAAARVTAYTPASTRPLVEVRAMVKDRLIASQSAEMAKKEGVEKLAAWKAAAPANMPASVTVSREGPQVVPGPVLDAILHADTSNLPVWVGVDLGTQGYAVARVNQVLPRSAPVQATGDQERKQYAQWVASAENKAYYKLLTQRFKVAIKAPRPAANALGPETLAE